MRPVLQTANEATRGFILVIFEPAENESSEPEAALEINEPLNKKLEDELFRSQTRFRQLVEQSEVQAEELKASNEELQAINEELRSATEELETGKEELQSVNEELVTVNQELKVKIEELSQSNNDFRNLMNSSQIGTIFLNRDFRVKMFTPAAGEIFNLIPSDVGRALSDITHNLKYEYLIADVEKVLEKLQPIEREVCTHNGSIYLIQITPYRTTEDRISGTIISFVNINKIKQQESELRELNLRIERQAEIFDTTLSFINDFAYIFDKEGRFLYANKPLLDLLKITSEEIKGKNFFDLNYPDELAARMQKQIQHVFDTQEMVRDETKFASHSGENGFHEYIFNPVISADGQVELVVGSTRDVTMRKLSEELLRESEERLRLIMKSVEDYAIITSDKNGIINDWNAGAEKLFGYSGKRDHRQTHRQLFSRPKTASEANRNGNTKGGWKPVAPKTNAGTFAKTARAFSSPA